MLCLLHCLQLLISSFNSIWPCILSFGVRRTLMLFSLLSSHWSLSVVGRMCWMNEIHCTYGKSIHSFAYDPSLSLIRTHSSMCVAFTHSRFIFISIASGLVWCVCARCMGLCMAHFFAARTEIIRTSLSEMVNEWTTVDFVFIFLCDRFTAKKISFHFFLLFHRR